jgi:hypothetical protein
MESNGVKLMAWRNLNLRTRGFRSNGAAMAGPLKQNPKKKKAYLGVAKARPKALYSFLKTLWAKRLVNKHKSMAEKCCSKTRLFKTLEVNPRCKTN